MSYTEKLHLFHYNGSLGQQKIKYTANLTLFFPTQPPILVKDGQNKNASTKTAA